MGFEVVPCLTSQGRTVLANGSYQIKKLRQKYLAYRLMGTFNLDICLYQAKDHNSGQIKTSKIVLKHYLQNILLIGTKDSNGLGAPWLLQK